MATLLCELKCGWQPRRRFRHAVSGGACAAFGQLSGQRRAALIDHGRQVAVRSGVDRTMRQWASRQPAGDGWPGSDQH